MARQFSVFIDLVANNKNATKEINSVSAALNAVGKASLAIGGALTGASAAMVAAWVPVERALTAATLSAVNAGYSVDELAQKAFAAGRGTPHSMEAIATAFAGLATAGISASQSTDYLTLAMALADSSGFSLYRSVDTVKTALELFNLDAAGTGRLLDVMTRASQNNLISMDSLNQTFARSASNAAAAGFGYEGLINWTTLLYDANIRGSQAGTAINAAIADLTAPTDQAAAAMYRLGLNVFDAYGAVRPLDEIFHDLRDTLGPMTDQQRAYYMNLISTATGARALNEVITASDEAFAQLVSTMETYGYTADQAARMNATMSGQMAIMRNTMDTVRVMIGQALAPAFATFNTYLSRGADFLADNVETLQRLAPVVLATGAALTAFGAAIKVVYAAQKALNTIKQIAAALKLAKVAPILLVVGGLAALGFAANDAGVDVDFIAGKIDNFLADILPNVIETIGRVVERLPELVTQIVNAITTHLPRFLAAGIELFTQLVNAITEILPVLIAGIVDLITRLVPVLIAQVPVILTAAIELFTALISSLAPIIPDLITAIIALVAGLVPVIIEQVPVLLAAAGELFMAIVQAVPTIVVSLVEAIGELWLALFDAISGWWDNLKEAGRNIVSSIAEGIRGAASRVTDAIGTVVGGIRNFLPFSPARTGPLSGAGSPQLAGQRIVEMLAEGMTQAAAEATMAAENLARSVNDGYSRVLEIAAINADALELVRRGMDEMTANLYRQARFTAAGITSGFEAEISLIPGVTGTALEQVRRKFSDAEWVTFQAARRFSEGLTTTYRNNLRIAEVTRDALSLVQAGMEYSEAILWARGTLLAEGISHSFDDGLTVSDVMQTELERTIAAIEQNYDPAIASMRVFMEGINDEMRRTNELEQIMSEAFAAIEAGFDHYEAVLAVQARQIALGISYGMEAYLTFPDIAGRLGQALNDAQRVANENVIRIPAPQVPSLPANPAGNWRPPGAGAGDEWFWNGANWQMNHGGNNGLRGFTSEITTALENVVGDLAQYARFANVDRVLA